MPKWVAWLLLSVVIVGFVGAVWVFSFRERASEAEVTRLAYAKFGRAGPPIRCIAQDGNHSRFHCVSPRFGDDPNCVPADADVFGNISIPSKIWACE